MMYKRYERYKDSGIEWIGKIPENWFLIRLKNAVELVTRKTTKDDSGKPYIGLEHVQSWTGKLIYVDENNNENDPSEELANTFKPGQVLFGKLRPYLAKGFLANFHGRCSSELLVLEPEKVIPSYLLYTVLTEGFIETVNSSTYGAKMPRASWSFIGNMIIPQPTYENQKAIVKYLDHKTSEVDSLIADKEKLIEKLEEYKQSIITEAVTKGLDPNVEMKNSGIEWIGEIPEHWETKKIKHICKSIDYGLNIPADNYADQGIRFIRTTDIMDNGQLSNSGVFINNMVDKRYLLVDGDVLVSRSGSLGTSFIFDATDYNQSTFAGYLIRLKVDELNSPKFLFYFTKSLIFTHQINVNLITSTISNFNANKYSNMILAVPVLMEQEAIASYLDHKTFEIDSIISDTNHQIEDLKQYRQSLIYEAVTGKVKVIN